MHANSLWVNRPHFCQTVHELMVTQSATLVSTPSASVLDITLNNTEMVNRWAYHQSRSHLEYRRVIIVYFLKQVMSNQYRARPGARRIKSVNLTRFHGSQKPVTSITAFCFVFGKSLCRAYAINTCIKLNLLQHDQFLCESLTKWNAACIIFIIVNSYCDLDSGFIHNAFIMSIRTHGMAWPGHALR